MSQRFFVETPITGPLAQLAGDEAHHLARVMRAKAGDIVWLFDGSGIDFEARILSARKQLVELEIVSSRPGKVSSQHVTIAVSLPKGDRQHVLVEKLSELGVERLIPLMTERSVANAAAAGERLQRWMLEACKQCERSQLMSISEPHSITELSKLPAEGFRGVAHPAGAPLHHASQAASGRKLMAIGPEGGFTDAEVEQLQSAGFTSISLGPLILRIETAAIAAAAILSQP